MSWIVQVPPTSPTSGYTYHPLTDTYTNDGPSKFPGTLETFTNWTGSIGPVDGRFDYFFPVVLPNSCDTCGGTGTVEIDFAADWQVIIAEPGSASLFSVGLAWIVMRKRRRAH
jgi:hypothetical protein